MSKKAQIFLLMLTIVGITSYNSLYAELLLLKQTETGFCPLDDSDTPHKKTIEDIVLKYQWPMSSALAFEPFATRNALLETTGDLFTPDKPNAEELFIEQEIHKQTGNSSYRVIFFPTTLYELFVIFETFNSYSPENPLQNALHTLDTLPTLDLQLLLSSNLSPQIIRTHIKEAYQVFNNVFFDGAPSAYSYINSQLAKKIFALYPDLEKTSSSLMLSHLIKEKTEELSIKLFDDLMYVLETTDKDPWFSKFPLEVSPEKIKIKLTQEGQRKIFTTIIRLEYNARSLNKGLVLRGTSFEKFSPFAIPEYPNSTLLAGLTVRLDEDDMSMEKSYAQHTSTPYSLSFGNSLLAGIFLDYTACAYKFLTSEKKSPGDGYGLFIDKHQYIENNSGNLFFISPLSTLASLYGNGEYFHSRSKAATLIKKDSYAPYYRGSRIRGLSAGIIEDPTGVLLITRDPFKHGVLFSQFLAENGVIIQAAEDEIEGFEEDVLQAQQKASKYLEGIQVLVPAIKKFEKKFRDTHPLL
jgi:hypothetical protein